MGTRTFITIEFLRQLVVGVAYVYKTIYIGFLCINIKIDCSGYEMKSFEFANLWKK
jgi:hypothetical protein